jgi:hypothetical protein
MHTTYRALSVALVIGLSTRYAAAEPPAAAVVPAAPAVHDSPPLLAYVVGAIGMSGISVAGVTGFLALNQKGIAEDHCSPTLQLCDAAGKAANDTGRTLRDISTAAWIVGGLGVGLSAYLLLTAPSTQRDVGLGVVVDGTTPKAALVAHF